MDAKLFLVDGSPTPGNIIKMDQENVLVNLQLPGRTVAQQMQFEQEIPIGIRQLGTTGRAAGVEPSIVPNSVRHRCKTHAVSANADPRISTQLFSGGLMNATKLLSLRMLGRFDNSLGILHIREERSEQRMQIVCALLWIS
jgi:hypothetical protein